MTSPGASVVAPILGAAGGTLVVTIAVERFKVKRPVAAFGTAAVSLIAARNATGAAARAGFEAAAIASICIGVTELLARMRQSKLQPAAPAQAPSAGPPKAQPAAPPRDAVTSSELRNALATLRAKHEADVERREESHRATTHALLQRLRETPHANRRVHVVDGSVEPATDPAVLAERMAAIYPLLDESERRRWSSMVATMPRAELVRIQRELMRRTPEDGVAFLRSSVLSTALRLSS